MPLAVLVVSYRRADLLARCLDSVREHLPDATTLVWDNQSATSGQIRDLARSYPGVRWTFADRNAGYAAAINALAGQLGEPHDLLLLNPDAELTGPLASCRAALAGDRVAAVSPTVADPGGGRPWDVARRRQTVLRALVSHTGYADKLRGTRFSDRYASRPGEVSGYLSGCCLLISAAAWAELGPFDERFFVYGEEAEWQRRATGVGWRLRLVDELDVRHGDHGTTAGDPVAAARGADLLRAGHAELLGLRGNYGPGAWFTAGLLVADRMQRSHRASRRAVLTARARPGKPSVLLTTNQLCQGGAERQRVLLANELAARGYPVTVACLQSFGPLAAELDPAVRLVLTPWWQPLLDLPGPDAVLITGITNTEAGFALGWRAARALRPGTHRWLAAAHEPAEAERPVYGSALGRIIARSDGVIALSERHWRDLNRHQKLHTRQHLIGNGVPGQRDRGFTPGKTLRLGMLSRIVEHKNPHLLVNALARLPELPWTLDIFGDGPDRAALAAQTPASVRDRVRWRGASPGPDHAFAEVDVLCVPSRAEAFPLVIVEAMARGLPVLASAVGSVPDLLDDGRAGILVDPVTEEAWADALRAVISRPRQLVPLAAAGAERASRLYTVDAMADGYLAAIADVMSR